LRATPDAARNFIDPFFSHWTPVIKALGLKPE